MGKNRITEGTANHEVLWSKDYIWIGIAAVEGVPLDVYTKTPHTSFGLIDINDGLRKAPLHEMVQVVEPDGTLGVVVPLELLFVTENNSQYIRGHRTGQEAVKLANDVISVEWHPVIQLTLSWSCRGTAVRSGLPRR